MSLKYFSVIIVATIMAVFAVLGASLIQPRSAETAATVPTCTGGTISLSDAEKRSLDLHNQTRASKGLSKFCIHPSLQAAARAHSKEMIDRDYFSHNSFNGESMANRLKRYGYTPQPNRYWTVGENIAYNTSTGVTSANTAYNGWMNSTGHKANILNSKFKQIGIGAHYGNYKGRNGTMWTADFGAR